MPLDGNSPAARPTAVLCDVMGTVLALDDPVPRLRAELAERGLTVSIDQAARAFRAEVAVYRARHLEGRDPASVDALRRACAEALRAELPAGLSAAAAYEVLMGSLRFTPFPGTTDALDRLHAVGIPVAAVSNWDASLDDALRETGLRDHFAAVVSSATVGSAKPDPAPLTHALGLLGGVPATSAVMIGDDPVDAAAAHALGMPYAIVGAGIAAVVDELLAIPA